MALLRKKRVLAAQIETTPGTAETLTAPDAAFNVYDATIQPNIETIPRMRQGSFGQQSSVTGPRGGTVTFSTYLEGSGAGGIPTWASTFLPACGWVAAAQVYSPATEDVGTNVKTITIGIFDDGLFKSIAGAVGTFTVEFPAGGLIKFNWTFQGLWQAPSDVAIISPTYPTNRPFRFASSTFTLGGASVGAVESITIDAGNEIYLRPDGTNATGYSYGLIGGRNMTGSWSSESRLIATESVFSEWLAGTEQALSINLDDGTDDITFAAPKLQRNDIQEGDRGGLLTDETSFQLNPSSGNDEFTITFAAGI